MSVNRDFRDLFAALNAAGADYLLVGGLAVAYLQDRIDLELLRKIAGP